MRTNIQSNIENKALEILSNTSSLQIPVPVDKIAHRLNLRVEFTELGDGVSGVLVIEDGQGTIGVNKFDPYVRQRFSIAHEIGHFELHQNIRKLFIDKNYTAIYRRDQNSSSGEHFWEIQANQFAAALLMPESLVLKEIKDMEFDLGDEKGIALLARRFQVSIQALSLRLAHLGMFPSDNH